MRKISIIPMINKSFLSCFFSNLTYYTYKERCHVIFLKIHFFHFLKTDLLRDIFILLSSANKKTTHLKKLEIDSIIFLFQNGDLCISILHPPVDDPHSGELPCERWNPTQNVR